MKQLVLLAIRSNIIVCFFFCFNIQLNAQLIPPQQEHVIQLNSNKALIAPSSPLLELGNEFTIEAWIFPQAYSDCDIICRNIDSEANISYELRLSNGGSNIEFLQTLGTWATSASIMQSDSIELNKWTHVAGSLEGDTLKLYINGELYGSALSPGTPVNSTIPLSIGNGLSSNSVPTNPGGLKGAICQVRIWNRALTVSEIHTQATQYLVGNESGLIAYWPCDDGIGNTVNDLSSNNLDLIMYSSYTYQILYPRWVSKSILENGPYFEISERTLINADPGISDGRFIDIGNDGNKDFLATQFIWPPDSAKLILLQNDGNFNFTERNDLIVNRDNSLTMHPRHLITDDFNNDGLTDLFIADQGRDDGPATGGQSMLVLQKSDGNVECYKNDRIPERLAFTHYATSGDVDNDGDNDIYMCNIWGNCYIHPEFYVNDGDAYFTDIASMLPSNVFNMEKKFTSSLLFDFDKDGDLDLYLGGHGGTALPVEGFLNDIILINDGEGDFSNSYITLPDRSGGLYTGTVSVASADFNNDGWLDLVLSVEHSYSQSWIQLLINNKDGSFSDASANIPQPEVNWNNWNWVYIFFPTDLNNDGWIDLVINNSGMESSVYYNMGNGVFNNCSEVIPLHSSAGFNMNGMKQFPEDINNDQKIDFLFSQQCATYYTGKNIQILTLNTPTVNLPIKPTIVSPMALTITSVTPTLSWIAQDSTHYMHIQVASDSAFSQIIYNNSSITANNQWRVQPLISDTLFWRIRGINNAGAGEWSDTATFIAKSDASLNNIDNNQDISIYPNPASEYAYLHFESNIKPNTIELEIYNIVGEKMQTVTSYKDNITSINLAGFSEGLYIVVIKTPSSYRTTKMLIKR